MTTDTEKRLSPNPPLETQLCCRVTKSGAPCKNMYIHPYTGVCSSHKTQADRDIEAAWSAGFSRGSEVYRSSSASAVRESNALKEEFRNRPCKHMRYEDGLGHQIVKVGVYTYRWHDKESPLKVGDLVVLPGSEYRPQRWEDTVSEIGSDYVGALKDVIARA